MNRRESTHILRTWLALCLLSVSSACGEGEIYSDSFPFYLDFKFEMTGEVERYANDLSGRTVASSVNNRFGSGLDIEDILCRAELEGTVHLIGFHYGAGVKDRVYGNARTLATLGPADDQLEIILVVSSGTVAAAGRATFDLSDALSYYPGLREDWNLRDCGPGARPADARCFEGGFAFPRGAGPNGEVLLDTLVQNCVP